MPSSHPSAHCAACDCAAAAPTKAAASRSGVWAALLPVLVCAVCPPCVATYTKLLSLAGVSLGVDEALHQVLRAAALVLSVGVSAGRSWHTGRAWPLLLAVGGSALVAAGHLLGEVPALEWAGVLVLVAGGWMERQLRRGVTG